MPFINNCNTLIRDSKKNLFRISKSDKITLELLDDNSNIIKSFILYNSYVSYLNISFDITDNDIIYGIINTSDGKVLYYEYENSNIHTSILFEYDCSKFNIAYPYIKRIKDTTHVFYYVGNINSNTSSALFHQYKKDNNWIENKINFINHIVLNNFVVLFKENTPYVYYFDKLNSSEEIFVSKFDDKSLNWNSPIQVTNSKRGKMYLSVIKDSLNLYHLTYAENMNGSYAIKYINGSLNNNLFNTNISKYLSEPLTCSFPSLSLVDNNIYIMWIQSNKLCTRVSNDIGKSWNKYSIDEFSSKEVFTRFYFKSNFLNDKKYNTDTVFSCIEEIGILGY